MSKTTPPKSNPNLIENDTQYEVVPRRRSERRSTEQQLDIKSELAVEDNDITVVDNKHADLVREGERRQSGRRTSRPTLLSVDEIEVLRKK
jgi:hypothetical protein